MSCIAVCICLFKFLKVCKRELARFLSPSPHHFCSRLGRENSNKSAKNPPKRTPKHPTGPQSSPKDPRATKQANFPSKTGHPGQKLHKYLHCEPIANLSSLQRSCLRAFAIPNTNFHTRDTPVFKALRSQQQERTPLFSSKEHLKTAHLLDPRAVRRNVRGRDTPGFVDET